MIETPMQSYERRAAKQRVLDAERDARYAAHDAEMATIRQQFDAATERAAARGDFSNRPLASQRSAQKLGDGIAKRAQAWKDDAIERGVAQNVARTPEDHRSKPHPQGETREQANRGGAARKLAEAMRRKGIRSADARFGGGSGRLVAGERYFRMSVAFAANTHGVIYSAVTDEYRGRIPSDATWALACDLLAAMEGK